MHIIYTYIIHISPMFAQKRCHVSLPGVLQETAELAQVSFGGRLLRTIGWVYECSADQFIASCWGNFTVDGQLQSWKDKILEILELRTLSQHFTTFHKNSFVVQKKCNCRRVSLSRSVSSWQDPPKVVRYCKLILADHYPTGWNALHGGEDQSNVLRGQERLSSEGDDRCSGQRYVR